MAIQGVLRLGEAAIRVTDMEAALRHHDRASAFTGRYETSRVACI
jgi:hypothetical protein